MTQVQVKLYYTLLEYTGPNQTPPSTPPTSPSGPGHSQMQGIKNLQFNISESYNVIH